MSYERSEEEALKLVQRIPILIPEGSKAPELETEKILTADRVFLPEKRKHLKRLWKCERHNFYFPNERLLQWHVREAHRVE